MEARDAGARRPESEHQAFLRFHIQHDAHLQAAVGETVKGVILHV
jgi:hypothetical protein